MDKKLGVVVPYRRRYQQLINFKSAIRNYLNSKKIKFEIIIVDQDDAKTFNRGKLLNIGFKYAKKLNCDYVVFHDVDMLPVDVDYSYSDVPIHLATNFEPDGDFTRIIFDDYFGGVTIFPMSAFEEINGYSNEYWGWGFEDTDLFNRVIKSGLKCEVITMGKDEYVDSYLDLKELEYVKIPILNTMINGDFKVSVTASVETKYFNENKEYDEYPIFSIPGYNIGIFYNSFNRYFLQVYDCEKKPYSITSEILDDIVSEFTFEKVGNKISFKINDDLIGEIFLENEILNYGHEFIYVGSFSSENLVEFDMKVININLNGVDLNLKDLDVQGGGIFIDEPLLLKTVLPKPFRRDGVFKQLEHESNASKNKSWVHQETRLNQVFYNNFVKQNLIDYTKEGLNTLEYKIISEENYTNYKFLSVEI